MRFARKAVRAAVMLAAIPFAAPAATAGNEWPAFRGASFDGTADVDDVFTGNRFRLDVVWKKKIGSGYSGIAVADDTVVTMFSDGTNDVVSAMDAKNGKERWRFELGPTYEGHDGSHTGPISTPLIADGKVAALAPRGMLFVLSLADGGLIWSADLAEDHQAPKPHYGFTTSPILVGDRMIVEIGGPEAAIGAFDLASGEVLWTSGSDNIAYQTPITTQVNGKTEIIAAGMTRVWGVDPETGAELWSHEHGGGGGRGAGSMTPVVAGEGRYFLAHRDDGGALITVSRDGEAATVANAWESRAIRNSYNVPVYHEGHIYGFSSRFLTCVDAATGEAKWRSREPGDGFLILVDDHLVVITKEGSLHVVEASPAGFTQVAARDLFTELSWSNPAFADGHIFVRSMDEIARVKIRAGGSGLLAEGLSPDARGTKFGKFLRDLKKQDDKAAAIDAYMKTVDSFPIVEGNVVHFVYRGEADDVAVAGDLIGARQEAPMQRIAGTDLWVYSAKIEKDARLNYLFIKDYEETVDPLNDRQTRSFIYGPEMEMAFGPGDGLPMSWFAMPEWSEPGYLRDPAETVRGTMNEHAVETELPFPVKLNVHVPHGYADSADTRYPVVYFHGGPGARTLGRVTEALDNMIADGQIDPVIAVFIEAAGQVPPPAYAGLFGEKVVPMVDEAYRTVASAEGRASVGQGFGGYYAMIAALGAPGTVGKVGTQSVFMFTSMEPGLTSVLKTADEVPLEIYMDWGRYDLRNPHEAWDMSATNEQLAKTLESKGYDVEGGAVADGTGWDSWRVRTDDVMRALFPKGP